MKKAIVKTDSFILRKGEKVYIEKCTNGIINGYHVYTTDNINSWLCNVFYNDVEIIK